MNPLLEKLHDIEGLDTISAWPFSATMWGLIFFLAAIGGAAVFFGIQYIRFRWSWKYDAIQKLFSLEANLSEDTSKETAIILSEYVRRIALQRFPRKECAGLAGTAWLQWLTSHDPKQFDWKSKGTFLVEAPYHPQKVKISLESVREVIQAMKDWVR